MVVVGNIVSLNPFLFVFITTSVIINTIIIIVTIATLLLSLLIYRHLLLQYPNRNYDSLPFFPLTHHHYHYSHHHHTFSPLPPNKTNRPKIHTNNISYYSNFSLSHQNLLTKSGFCFILPESTAHVSILLRRRQI